MKLVNLTLKIGLLRTTTQRRTYSVRLLHACTEVILFIFHTYLKKIRIVRNYRIPLANVSAAMVYEAETYEREFVEVPTYAGKGLKIN